MKYIPLRKGYTENQLQYYPTLEDNSEIVPNIHKNDILPVSGLNSQIKPFAFGSSPGLRPRELPQALIALIDGVSLVLS